MEAKDTRLAVAVSALLFTVTVLPWLASRAAVSFAANGPGPAPAGAEELEDHLRRLFAARAAALLAGGDPADVEPLYDTTVKYGRWALHREQRKIRYVHSWAGLRGVRVTAAQVELRIHSVARDGDTAWVNLTQTLGLDYVYPDGGGAELNRAGIGTRHTMQLARREGRWLIRRDWFTDPLGEDAVVPDVTPAGAPPSAAASGPAPPPAPPEPRPGGGAGPRYRRAAAVAYADRYCGAARGCGNDGRYNPRYRDYTDAGGDCANFASQVLGDPEGGALPTDAVWHADEAGAGSRAWVHAESLLRYLLDSGRAHRLARGTFSEVSRPTPAHPQGAIRALRGGDLIAYEEKGRVEHLAVVVGTDSRGYPLVDSHTADRYHVPWDMGWDRSTVFWAVRVAD